MLFIIGAVVDKFVLFRKRFRVRVGLSSLSTACHRQRILSPESYPYVWIVTYVGLWGYLVVLMEITAGASKSKIQDPKHDIL